MSFPHVHFKKCSDSFTGEYLTRNLIKLINTLTASKYLFFWWDFANNVLSQEPFLFFSSTIFLFFISRFLNGIKFSYSQMRFYYTPSILPFVSCSFSLFSRFFENFPSVRTMISVTVTSWQRCGVYPVFRFPLFSVSYLVQRWRSRGNWFFY